MQIKYSLLDGSVGKNGIIFGADLNSLMNIDNVGRSIVILGKGVIQGLYHTLAAETQYSINFTRTGIKCCLSLYYNGINSFLFANASKMHQFKAKDSEIEKISFVFRKYFRRFFS